MDKRRYSSKADPTRRRILDATLECLSRTSARELSVRAIAAAAGVNVATVHYYFGTKDAVITEALQIFFAPLLERLDQLSLAEGEPEQRLEGFIAFYIKEFRGHPGVFASIIEALLASNIRSDPKASEAYEQALFGVIAIAKDRIMKLVGLISGIEDSRLLAIRTLQVMASVVHPLLISTLPLELFGVDFSEAANQESYVSFLVASLSRECGGRQASATTART